MWIIPSNHPLSSAFAQEYLDSKEGLQELVSTVVSLPTWKSKPSSLQTWLRAWKRVFWVPPLFGRMLKPSMHDRFVDEYTASLVVIHVPENHLPGFGKAISIKDSFGRLYAALSQQLDLFGAFSKTWMTILRDRTRLYKEAYTIWVIELRQESIRRRNLARHMKGQGFLSLQWKTPIASDCANHAGKTGNGCGMSLGTAVQLWPTVSARGWKSGESNQHGKNSRPLNEVVKLFPTPYATMEKKYKLKKGSQAADKNLSAMARRGELASQMAPEIINTNGKNREQLNPAWVAQLMGTTLEKIFFVPLVTQSWNKLQK